MSSPLELLHPVAPAIGSSRDIIALAKSFAAQRSLVLFSSIVTTGLCIYFVTNFIYNVFFHPYAKYPGPFLAKFTDLYAGYHAWKGDIHLDMWRCHLKYGDKVRYAPNRLNVNTVTGLKSKWSIFFEEYIILTLIQTSTARASPISRAKTMLLWFTKLPTP